MGEKSKDPEWTPSFTSDGDDSFYSDEYYFSDLDDGSNYDSGE